jgi:hypothetical protein
MKVRYYSHYHHKMEDLVRAYPDIEHARIYTLRYLDLRMCLLDAGSHEPFVPFLTHSIYAGSYNIEQTLKNNPEKSNLLVHLPDAKPRNSMKNREEC